MHLLLVKRVFWVCLLLFPLKSTAQTQQEDAIKNTITNFFSAMRNGDTLSMRQQLAPGALLHTVSPDKGLRSQDINAFLRSVSQAPKGSLDERITFTSVQVDGPLAAVWTAYQFYYQGQLSHCGANSFLLHQVEGKWKIHYLVDTRRKDACP